MPFFCMRCVAGSRVFEPISTVCMYFRFKLSADQSIFSSLPFLNLNEKKTVILKIM
jgi:hypothetical protein